MSSVLSQAHLHERQTNSLSPDNNLDDGGQARQNSVGYIMEQPHRFRFRDKFPVFIVWVAAVAAGISSQWTYALPALALFLAICSTILLFIAPSVTYFKLGLSSDYQAIPNFFGLIPNQVRMRITQLFGLILFMTNVAIGIYACTLVNRH
jgi:hypothetical protein